MNWTVFSAIAEAIGVLAVVISLLYLAFQIRFARIAAADTSRTARAIGIREIDLTMVNNGELRENWLKSSDLNSLYKVMATEMDINIDGALQVDTLCQCWMRLHWGHYRSITTPKDLQELESLVSAFYSRPPMSISWKNSPYGKQAYDKDFIGFIENAIAKSDNM